MDFTGLAEVQDAIRELGIEIEEEKDVFKALGGLLHLGQVRSASGYPCRLPHLCTRVLYDTIFNVFSTLDWRVPRKHQASMYFAAFSHGRLV